MLITICSQRNCTDENIDYFRFSTVTLWLVTFLLHTVHVHVCNRNVCDLTTHNMALFPGELHQTGRNRKPTSLPCQLTTSSIGQKQKF